jgi:hypothetical protein
MKICLNLNDNNKEIKYILLSDQYELSPDKTNNISDAK